MLWCMDRTTPKALALGREIRLAREQAGYGLREFAKLINENHSVLSRIESGERPPSAEKASALLGRLGVTGAELERIVDLARNAEGSVWLAVGLPEQQAQLAALIEFEQMATDIVACSPLLPPGLSQSGPFIRALMRDADVPRDEIETRTVIRVGRSDAITRANPVVYTAYIGLAVFRQIIGGPKVMAEQFEHMAKLAALPNVHLHAVPDNAGWHPGLEGPFSLLSLPAMKVVHLENRRSGLFLHQEQDVAAYSEAVEKLRRVAMSEQETAELIVRAADGMRRNE